MTENAVNELNVEELLKEKEALKKLQEEIDGKIKKSKSQQRLSMLDKILELMKGYDISLSDIVIAENKPSKLKGSLPAKKDERKKLVKPPEGHIYYNEEKRERWTGKGRPKESIRNHPDPKSLLILIENLPENKDQKSPLIPIEDLPKKK